METYHWRGGARETIRVNWRGVRAGFIVRRQSQTGYVTGHLTDRGGWGRPSVANVFETAQDAADAGHRAMARFFAVLHNQPR